ncbi:DUF309 domain-containing protein [Caldivirga sp. MU80]|jgi:hypothetical protein|uniref:DUF309 domain-containing protein n=1 Tax=Caldivirga sp. MU80 TaxID=1650354 RepID=UPI0008309C16|nr:DUF309 domain-containing protein [Caldivirga sp. MU80]
MRVLIYLSNTRGYEPKDRVNLMKQLRSMGIRVINVRVATRHLEVDASTDNVDEAAHTLGLLIGPVLEVVNLTMEHRYDNPFRAYVDLFNGERFWEAHEALEPIWRVGRDVNVQGLIVAAAAFVKLQEGYIEPFLRLANRALSMLTASAVDCIDLVSFRAGLKDALGVMRPFRARCIN